MKSHSSLYRGVNRDYSRNKWMARIKKAGKIIYLGRFDDEILAAKAYDAAAVKEFGQFARTNFIPQKDKSLDVIYRICSACGIEKILKDFPNKLGPGRADTKCTLCKIYLARDSELKNKYGMSMLDYKKLLNSQDGKCAICRSDNPGYKRSSFCVDHDHTTGYVRGLICGSCNFGIGNFKDNQIFLMSAAEYVKKSKTQYRRE